MDLLKDISKSLNFQDRYSEMEGAQTGTANEGFDSAEYKALKNAQKGGATLSATEKERLKYLNTVRDEQIRAATTLGAAAAGTVVGAYTGNPAMVTSSLSMGANYVMGEAGEVDGPNDGTGQQLGFEDIATAVTPMATTIGQGSKKKGEKGDDGAPLVDGGDGQDLSRDDVKKETSTVDQLLGSLTSMATAKNGRKLEYASGGKMELRNRYNPRKHDYIKGNTFGFGLK